MSVPALDEKALRALVEEVVRAIITRQMGFPADAAKPKPLVVVLAGAERGHDEALALVRQLAAAGPIEVIAPICYRDRNGCTKLLRKLGEFPVHENLLPAQREALVRRSGGLVLLLPQRCTIAKSARGLADSLPTQMLVDALAHGIPTFCAGGEADEQSWPATMPAMMRRGPESLGRLLEQDLKTLTMWGMQFRRHPAELFGLIVKAWNRPQSAWERLLKPPEVALSGGPKLHVSSGFVTVSDLREFHRDGGRHLRIVPPLKLTDAALEEARQLQITVEE